MTDQLELTAVRATDPETSRLAAVYTFQNVVRDRARVLVALAAAGAAGLTDFELERETGIKQTSCGKRRGELRDDGLVMALSTPDEEHPCRRRPVRRLALSGIPAQVWAVTPTGVEAAARLTESAVA